MFVHCFFEQSGTFKRAFNKFGFNAFDYDIKNDFNCTDFIVDLFDNIERAYSGMSSIFDNISSGDLIFAFFPCVRFTKRMKVNFKRVLNNKTDIDRLNENIRYFNETAYFYELLNKLCIVCLQCGIKLIVENPYSTDSILTQYFYYNYSVLNNNRSIFGDFYKKPTQYFFIGFKPNCNFEFNFIDYKSIKRINEVHNSVERSLISIDYAENFIKTYIL